MDAKITKHSDRIDEISLFQSFSISEVDHGKGVFPSRNSPNVMSFFLAKLVAFIWVIILLLNIMMLTTIVGQESTCSSLDQPDGNAQTENAAHREKRNADISLETRANAFTGVPVDVQSENMTALHKKVTELESKIESSIEEQFIGISKRLDSHIAEMIDGHVADLKNTTRNELENGDSSIIRLLTSQMDCKTSMVSEMVEIGQNLTCLDDKLTKQISFIIRNLVTSAMGLGNELESHNTNTWSNSSIEYLQTLENYITSHMSQIRELVDMQKEILEEVHYNVNLIKQYSPETNSTKYSLLDEAVEACASNTVIQAQSLNTDVLKSIGNLTDKLFKIVIEPKEITDDTEKPAENKYWESFCLHLHNVRPIRTTCYNFTVDDKTKSAIHCYAVDIFDRITWYNAKDRCARLGGYLAEVNSKNEFRSMLAFNFDRVKGRFWLGGTDMKEEGKWLWDHSQQEFNFTSWKKGEPNNYGEKGEHCLSTWTKSSQWIDAPCHSKKNYICEFTADNCQNLVINIFKE